LVLDEADEMISMGFKEELDKILTNISKESCNTWLFSATMSREVRRVADDYLTKPQQVQINQKEMLSTTVEQIYYMTAEGNKPEVLCKLIDSAEDFYGIIFCQTKALVSDLTQYLSGRGYRVDSLHGDKDQAGRERTMRSFRERNVNMLVCTDVASRGLDVKDVTHVVNYSIPRELDSYVHRIGRTARSGKAGLAFSLVTRSQRGLVDRIERATRSKFKEGIIPGRKEVGTKKVNALFAEFDSQKLFGRAASVLNDEWKAALAKMTPEEVAGRFLTMRFPEVFNDEAQKGLQGSHEEERSPRREERRGPRGGGDNRSHGGGGGRHGGGGRNRSRSRSRR
jgi:ATP-dependent RNA helicase DeaD